MPRKLAAKAKKKLSAMKKKGSRLKKKKLATKAKKKVLAIPKGYNTITPYLIVREASAAIDFYKAAFNAKEVMRMEQPEGKIGHAELKLGDAKFMLADENSELGARSPEQYGGSPMSIHLYIKNVDELVAKAVSAGAKLIRPAENMFYGDRTACLEDPYGYKWYVATHIEDVTPKEMKKRIAELFEKE